MRSVFLLVCLAGCTRSALSIDGDGGGGAGDLAMRSTDLAGADFSMPPGGPHDLSLPPVSDLAGAVCYSTCNHCTTGACCPGGAGGCCHAGEWCDASGQCRCGQAGACPPTNPLCATGGPIMGGGSCGGICCGGSTPCPL